VPVVANVDARAHPGPAEWPGLLSAQLCSPVRWRQSLVMLGEMGATRVVEVGPGGVLTALARRTLPEVEALSVASPDDLAVLVKTLSGSETWQAYASAHQGEHLYTSERVVVSPSAGVFSPDPGLAAPGPGGLTPVGASPTGGGGNGGGGPGGPGDIEVVVGALLGHVGETEVRTPFAGQVVGFLAHAGERVMAGQPLAWLRVSTAGS
jgi:[acyl-carrier-protein] S-malonyltransferase